MKTPEEIKKGLECCDFEHWQGRKCEQCPYMNADDEWCDSMDEIRGDAIAYIQQLESQVPKWISVEERLPEKSGYYLCWVPKYTTTDVIHYSAKYMAFNAFDTTYISESALPVTRWMPLPEPPKEEDHATD